MNRWKIPLSVLAALALIAGVLFATPILGGTDASAATANGSFVLWAGQTINAGSGRETRSK